MKSLSPLSERDRRALLALSVAAALLLIVRWVAFPLWDAAAAPESAIPVREKTLRKYRGLAEAAPARESDFSALQARLAAAEAGLVASRTAPLAAAEVQQQVRDMAAASGLQLRSVDFLPLKKLGTEYAVVPVSVHFQARMDQLLNLLNALRGAQKTLIVEQLRISAANEPGKKQVNVFLTVSGVCSAEALKPEAAP